jgi:YD repeat-containing protein
VTGIVRDAHGRVTRLDYSDNTFVAYAYDSVGNITRVEDVTGVTTLDYTFNHQLEQITYPGNRFLEYSYDSAGRRVFMQDHAGYRLDYAYNGEGLLESVMDGSGASHAR